MQFESASTGSVFASERPLNNERILGAICARLSAPIPGPLVQAHLDANDAVANRDGDVSYESVAAQVRQRHAAAVRAHELATKEDWQETAGFELYRLHHLFLLAETDLCRVSSHEKAAATREWSSILQRQTQRPLRQANAAHNSRKRRQTAEEVPLSPTTKRVRLSPKSATAPAAAPTS